MRPLNGLEKQNLALLDSWGIDHGYLQPTENGLSKTIIDAILPYREFLLRQKIHDYELQDNDGRTNAKKLATAFVAEDRIVSLPDASLYRARERGDRRIWFPEIRRFVLGGDTVVSLWLNSKLYLLNASRMDFRNSVALSSLRGPVPLSSELREYLAQIGTEYRSRSSRSRGDGLLHRAAEVIGPLIPGGLQVVVNEPAGTASDAPWIAILDPDETTTPEEGILLALIFKEDMQEVVLAVSQGAGAPASTSGSDAELTLRRHKANLLQLGLIQFIADLGANTGPASDATNEVLFAGTIASLTYSLASMPDEDSLREDVTRMLEIYQNAVLLKEAALGGVAKDGTRTPANPSLLDKSRRHPPRAFKPKNRTDYQVEIAGRTETRRGDRHEVLLAQYADHASHAGHQPSNTGVHPRDLTLQVDGQEWLVEAKVVYCGNASEAARAAVGQLAEYAHFLYEPNFPPRKMALFTEPLGKAFVEMLEAQGIAVVWKGPGGWEASPAAVEAGLI